MVAGSEVPPYYDSMIAKVITHGRNRETARRRLMSGLQDAVALGVITNQRFLGACLDHPVFAAGGATTAFIADHLETLLAVDPAMRARAIALSAVLMHETAGHREHHGQARLLAHTLAVLQRLNVNGEICAVRLGPSGPHRYAVECAGQTFDFRLIDLQYDHLRFDCDGVSEGAYYHRDGHQLWLSYQGLPVRVQDSSHQAPARRADTVSDGKLRASMNGRVVEVLVAVGDAVLAQQPLLTLEAMKMQHVHAAPMSGKVTAIHVRAGEQVGAARVLIEIAAGEA